MQPSSRSPFAQEPVCQRSPTHIGRHGQRSPNPRHNQNHR
ncbi:hypothetical protein HMPREF9056_01056 [Actinomyces sp. oral taxon 170 str. F0386]|nr:hypothetical protein HMPREF9056_01056 [Actinomyces sp. oral taxon 170 str. F0386]